MGKPTMATRSQSAGVSGAKEMAAELEKQTPTPWDLDLWEDSLWSAVAGHCVRHVIVVFPVFWFAIEILVCWVLCVWFAVRFSLAGDLSFRLHILGH